MERNDELKKIFDGFNPTLGSSRLFMEKLERRLAAVEYIKLMHDREVRRYKYAMLAAFVAGILMGGASIALILTHPEICKSFSFGAQSGLLLFLEDNLVFLLLAALAMFTGFAIISVSGLIQEIKGHTAARRFAPRKAGIVAAEPRGKEKA